MKGANNTIYEFLPDLYIEMGQDEVKQIYYKFFKQKNYVLYAEVESRLIKITAKNENSFVHKFVIYNIFATYSVDLEL